MQTSAAISLEEDVPLAPLTTLGVGGPARRLARCRDVAELRAALRLAAAEDTKTFVLGGGSNLLVADRGFDGLVVRLDDERLTMDDEGGSVLVRAAAGLDWDDLVAASVDAGLAGIECLSGIPGRVGAAPIQNVGAYGQEVAETIVAVDAVERATGHARRFLAAECGFGYRWSRFKGEEHGRWAVVGVTLRLARRPSGTVRYRDLERFFDLRPGGSAPTLAEVRHAVLEVRRSKSMVLDDADPNHRSAGSFFLNPVVTAEQAEDVRRRLDAGDEMPAFPSAGGQVKLSAAWLIERAGFRRGDARGRVAVSSRHALALVNTGGASAAEIVALAAEIRRGVDASCGIELRPEPFFLGFEDDVDTLLA